MVVEVFKCLWRYRNYLIIFLTPLLILPLPLVIKTSEANCGFVIILMALYWCTECIPLAVTALLPVILFPMMQIMESGEVCVQYLKDSNMLFIGGLLVAIAVEHWNLHKRIALRVLLIVGVKPALLMMGFMITTAFLSMWISNTASTAMMLPIAQAVLDQLARTEAAQEQERQAGAGVDNEGFQMGEVKDSPTKEPVGDEEWSSSVVEQRRLRLEQKYLKLSKGMSLSVCYAASIGGTATLTGTTPNLILKGQVDELFPDNGGIINFASWFGFSFPNMVLMLVLSWLWLQVMFLGLNFKETFGCGSKDKGDKEAYQVMKNEYKRLGNISYAEGSVLVIFVLLVALWFTREPGFMPGWATVLFNQEKAYVTDGTVAILMSTLFFLLPSRLPRCFSSDDEGSRKAPPTLLNWDVVHEKMPWNIILLLGGGFALARGSETSGLSKWLGNSLAPLKNIPPFAISLLLCMLVGTFTECSSNTATTTLFLPILASMATAIELHPLYVMLPCTICASLAFMLPVATPPNATTTTESSDAGVANKKKHLGIPEAVFVEDVDSFMKQPGNDTADAVLRRLDEQYQKYKYMELNLAQKKLRLKSQIPQIKQTLEILRHMQKKKDTTEPMETRFLLADNVHCKALVPPTDKVCLWLGANVMLEYDIDEAQSLLEKNLATASRNLDSLEEDLNFLRDQFTTTEVNMARVYNWDVKRRSKDNLSKLAEKS